MVRFFAILLVAGVAGAPALVRAQSSGIAAKPVVPDSEAAPSNLIPLPALPTGRSTVVGGVIGKIDPVMDELTLDVFGGQEMKIFFDARTQVYEDGVRESLADLRPEDHASVETTLDGDDVYALSVHMLSHTPQGECEGQVLSYNPGSGELTVRSRLTQESIRLLVPPGTAVVPVGQEAGPDADHGTEALLPGALVSVLFSSDNRGQGVANHISLLAAPGAAFDFSGNIVFLDLHSYQMVVLDPRDNKSYPIAFNPAGFPNAAELHPGAKVHVTARFDGRRYVATAITLQ